MPLNSTTKRKAKPAKLVSAPDGVAESAIGMLEPGFRMFGMTRGQFSLIDLVRAILRQTGPAHLCISTWTAGIRDVDNVEFLVSRGDILGLQLIVDRSFTSRQPEYARKVVQVFGDQAIRCTRTHAKFAIIRNDEWAITVRSSMNLNRNPRFEQFDIDDDPALADFLQAHVDEMCEMMPAGLYHKTNVVDSAFGRAMGGAPIDPALLDNSDALGDEMSVDRMLSSSPNLMPGLFDA